MSQSSITNAALNRGQELSAFTDLLMWWTWPLAMWESWISLASGGFVATEPEIDSGDRTAQLPVPDPLQKAKDSDLFA